MEIIAAATLFSVDVYIATDNYKPGKAVWLKYTPNGKIKTMPEVSTNIPFLSEKKGQWTEIAQVNNNHFDSINPIGVKYLSCPIKHFMKYTLNYLLYLLSKFIYLLSSL